ncbi:hypothetical protein OIU84_017882 [Salix udensis]|uniref:Ammonium transporter AmtB-like domain-containing protein n=1 Tax=Salix udensis TaxID=889485 RepID=A0AAD6L337_9ROSI|nr:hypothetical protein OIU84_017882 [Salix udensis]
MDSRMVRLLPDSGEMGIQLGGILFVIYINISTTSMVCWFVGLFVPLRFSDNELQDGDDAIHGEEASALWNDEETFQKTNSNSVFQAEDSSYKKSRSLGDVQMV